LTVDRQIAQGGAARVFLARDRAGRTVALKVLHPELAITVTAERFLREIGFLSKLDHPHIARLLDCGDTDRLVYYVMAYVEGPSLREHLERAGRATESETLRIAQDLLGALGYAHQRGIVHRDVKPDNVVLSSKGAVLLDFGIARAIARAGTNRLTRSGFCVGTSAYMSPEQVRAQDDIDHRSDLYSVGCVLYECLTGQPPFVAQQDEAVLRMHLEEEAPDVSTKRPDVASALTMAIDRALAADRADRWPSAAEMLAALGKTTG
jgi:serine/threonine-protein kinase